MPVFKIEYSLSFEEILPTTLKAQTKRSLPDQLSTDDFYILRTLQNTLKYPLKGISSFPHMYIFIPYPSSLEYLFIYVHMYICIHVYISIYTFYPWFTLFPTYLSDFWYFSVLQLWLTQALVNSYLIKQSWEGLCAIDLNLESSLRNSSKCYF